MTDDLISRQALIDRLTVFNEWCKDGRLQGSMFAVDVIKDMPSAEKIGHWIYVYGYVPIYNAGGFTEKRKIGVKCSNCQRLNTWCKFDYCPNCGAKMEGE